MDARIAEIQQQLRERDAEINRLQRGLRVSNKKNENILWVFSEDTYCYSTDINFICAVTFLCAQVWATSREESVAAVQSPPQKPQVSWTLTY